MGRQEDEKEIVVIMQKTVTSCCDSSITNKSDLFWCYSQKRSDFVCNFMILFMKS